MCLCCVFMNDLKTTSEIYILTFRVCLCFVFVVKRSSLFLFCVMCSNRKKKFVRKIWTILKVNRKIERRVVVWNLLLFMQDCPDETCLHTNMHYIIITMREFTVLVYCRRTYYCPVMMMMSLCPMQS